MLIFSVLALLNIGRSIGTKFGNDVLDYCCSERRSPGCCVELYAQYIYRSINRTAIWKGKRVINSHLFARDVKNSFLKCVLWNEIYIFGE